MCDDFLGGFLTDFRHNWPTMSHTFWYSESTQNTSVETRKKAFNTII